jgi:hypothetical protein
LLRPTLKRSKIVRSFQERVPYLKKSFWLEYENLRYQCSTNATCGIRCVSDAVYLYSAGWVTGAHIASS